MCNRYRRFAKWAESVARCSLYVLTRVEEERGNDGHRSPGQDIEHFGVGTGLGRGLRSPRPTSACAPRVPTSCRPSCCGGWRSPTAPRTRTSCRSRSPAEVVRAIRNLGELVGRGGTIQATCRTCGKVALFEAGELAAHFRAKHWNDAWPAFAARLRCAGSDGCGARKPKVAWLIGNPPPDEDPDPPKPRLVRKPSTAPAGISQADWEAAKSDRERRRLIRIARG